MLHAVKKRGLAEYIKKVSKSQYVNNRPFIDSQKVMFYVYLHDDADYSSAVKRCKMLKALNTNAFVMTNRNVKRTKRMRSLARWANRKWFYWSCDIEDYEG